MKRKYLKIISISIFFNTIIIFSFLTPLYSAEPGTNLIEPHSSEFYICTDKKGIGPLWLTDTPQNATDSKYKYQCVAMALYYERTFENKKLPKERSRSVNNK